MKCQLLNQDAKRGTQEKREEKHQHDTPGPERANPERAREKKSGGRRTRNQTSGGGGGRKRLNQLTTAKPTLTSARTEPNLPEERRTQEHMKKGPMGD